MSFRITLLSLGLLGLLSDSAHAFAPTDAVHVGIEPQRILRYDAPTQVALAQTPAWQEFLAAEGDGWKARFDQKTGTAHRMWGPGIDIGPTSTPEQVEQGVLAFLAANEGIVGVDANSLQIRSSSYNERVDTWFVDVDVVHLGAPIWRGGVTARIKHGSLVLVGIDTYPDVPHVGRAALSADAAIDRGIAQGPAAAVPHTGTSAELVWLPQEIGGELQLRLCWMTRSHTASPPGIWVSFVDASSGELVNVHNEVRFATGTVYGSHAVRTLDGKTTTSVMPLIKVTGDDGTTVTAGEDGSFTTSGTGTSFSSVLDGSYVRAVNDAGDEGALSFSGSSGTWTTTSATQAEISTYAFLHHVRTWGQRVAPEVPMVSDKFKSTVNINDNCNAYYDGNLNFFRAGSGCNNTGEIADVNYHEWGHGFHYWSLESGDFDGSLGEGAADVVAFLQTADPIIAPFFMTNGQGIREVDTDKAYPQDYANDDWAVHSNGLIFGGAMWDLWHILMEKEGVEAGTASMERIFTGLLKGGPDVESSYDEAVVADDDDGNLGNGTPHYCDIIEAFAPHGLGPSGAGGSAVQVLHDPELLALADGDHPVAVDLWNVAEQCFAWTPTKATVTWRADGGSWETTALSLTGDGAEGSIPAQAEGSFVEYYVSVHDADGARVSAPRGEVINPFSFYVGGVLEVACTTFEDDDGGFKHELVEGEETLGADDWQWGIPLGEGGDPNAAYSGRFVWGNDLGDGEYNGEYQNEKTNRLTSPVYELSHYRDNFLAYQRWLNVEDAEFDHANIYADDEQVWTNWGSSSGEEHHQDAQWAPHVVSLGEAANDGSVSIAWEIDSDEGLSMGGWTIDDVCIFAPATPDNRLGISDFVASEGLDGGIDLTWTNPRHAPVERVMVVRASDDWPSGPTDGVVVFEDGAPELDTPMSVRDVAVDGEKTYYYAVYAFDGQDWLSWTIQGWNADTGEALSGEGEGGANLAKGGCACTSAPAPAAAWFGLGLAALLGLRRRRA